MVPGRAGESGSRSIVSIARLQAKTCGGCAPVYTELGTYGGFTLVETPAIAVTGGKALLPRVPASTRAGPGLADDVASAGLTPVTRSISACRSPAARRTPM